MARRPRARGNGLSKLSIQELQAEMRRRQRAVGGLVRRRDRLAAKLARLDEQIAMLGGESGGGGMGRRGGGGRRPRNEKNLVEALSDVLSGKTMGVTEAAEAVQRAGYRTSAANFRTIVNQTLIKSDRFKKVSRGQYTAK